MKYVLVRYRVHPDRIDENERLVKEVYAELERHCPPGLEYATYRLPDGASFLHLARIDTADGSNPLLALESFKRFTAGIADRCAERPSTSELQVVGAYRPR